MDNIVFPTVSFQGATIDEAIEFLRLKSRDLDTMEKNPERRGVNIIVRAGDQPVTNQITLDLKEVPMSEALRYITELAGMKYKIDSFAVIVVPISDLGNEMYTEIFRVPPDFLTAQGAADAGGGAAAAPADPFAAGGGAAPAAGAALIRRKTAKQILEEAGIPFPEGSSANFIASSSQLVVRNTRPNLDAVQTFVEELQKNVTKQVYIQTKFVEVSQKNTDELGFDWLLGPFNIPGSERVFGSGGAEGNSANGPLNAVDFPVRFPGTDAPPVGQNPLTRANRSGTAAISPDSIDGLIAAPNVVSSLAPGMLAF
jgi:general secretion pathway protein D